MNNRFLWTVDTARIAPQKWQIMRGETVELVAHITNYREPLDLSAASATAYWQTPDMGDAWYTASASVSGDSLTWVWTPENDAGASAYDYFLGVEDGAGLSYRPFGKIEMLGSPAGNPSAVPIPTTFLDFEKYTILNAPYYTQTETDALLVSAIPTKVSQLRNDAGYLAAPVGTSAIANNAITNTKIANGSVTWAKLSSDTQNTIGGKVDKDGDLMTGNLLFSVPGNCYLYVSDTYFSGYISSPDANMMDVQNGDFTIVFDGTFSWFDGEGNLCDESGTWEVSYSVSDGYGDNTTPFTIGGMDIASNIYVTQYDGGRYVDLSFEGYSDTEYLQIYVYLTDSNVTEEERAKNGNAATEDDVERATAQTLQYAQEYASGLVQSHNGSASAHSSLLSKFRKMGHLQTLNYIQGGPSSLTLPAWGCAYYSNCAAAGYTYTFNLPRLYGDEDKSKHQLVASLDLFVGLQKKTKRIYISFPWGAAAQNRTATLTIYNGDDHSGWFEEKGATYAFGKIHVDVFIWADMAPASINPPAISLELIPRDLVSATAITDDNCETGKQIHWDKIL